jgi:hypothetical protein
MTTNLDIATQAYIACALWSSCAIDNEGNKIESLSDYDVTPETEAAMRSDVEDFVALVNKTDPALLDGISDEMIGHDFWLTRNGHGAGFWDRGLGEQGDRLTDLAKTYGARDLCLSDDGLVYQL